MRQESGQAAKALGEQVRAIGETAAVTTSTSRQIRQITQANREHSRVAEGLLAQVGEVRRIADRNAAGVKETRGTTSRLRDQARALTSIVEGRGASAGRRDSGNGAR
jgi:methyl-accepting chemotaxis protein